MKRIQANCQVCKQSKGMVLQKDVYKLCRSCSRKRVHANHAPEMKKHLSDLTSKQFMGHTPWNKNKTGVYSKDVLEKWSIAHTRLSSSEEFRKRISCTRRGIEIDDFTDFSTTIQERERVKIRNSGLTKEVYERDNYTCQCCDTRGAHLHAHHIESFDVNEALRFDINNLITLCKPCHNKFHSKYGKGSNTREQYLEYKQEYDLKPRKVAYILAGASGSGKDYVVDKLKNFTILQKDKLGKGIDHVISIVDSPLCVITVGVSTFIKNHPDIDFKLIVINESEEVIKERLINRGGTMTEGILRRIKRMQALSANAVFSGTSEEVLNYLNTVAHF